VENRRRASRERDAEELQFTLCQGARRSPPENLGQRGPRALEKVSEQSRRFVLINYIRFIVIDILRHVIKIILFYYNVYENDFIVINRYFKCFHCTCTDF